MQQAIVGFHQDEENHWVADQGRKEKLGVMLECKKCDKEGLV